MSLFSDSGDSGGDARALPLLDGGGLPGLPISYTGHDLLRLHCRTAYRQAIVVEVTMKRTSDKIAQHYCLGH